MRILLVDDDDPTRLICRRVLARMAPDARIDEAQDGARAIAALKAQAYDGILCDYRMGELSGIDVLSYALEARPSTYRVLMTGFADPRLEELARTKARVDDFIEKPMTSREFEEVIRRAFLAPLRERLQQAMSG